MGSIGIFRYLYLSMTDIAQLLISVILIHRIIPWQSNVHFLGCIMKLILAY